MSTSSRFESPPTAGRAGDAEVGISRPLAGIALAVLLLPGLSACSPPADREPGGRSLIFAHYASALHPMRAAVFGPFADRVAESSGGRLAVKEYLGGALGASLSRYYPLVLDGVVDIGFVLPGYTPSVFPRTALASYPGVCDDAIECTAALQRARPLLEGEYDARILALWSLPPPALLTRDRPVRRPEDLRGLKLRVSSRLEVPFMEALGASAVMLPISEVQQSLHNRVIDGVVTPASIVPQLQLQEAADYMTTWTPLSGLPLALLMNHDTWESLSSQERTWVDRAADASLAARGGEAYERANLEGLRVAREAGVELIELSDEEKARFEVAITDVYRTELSRRVGDLTVAEVLDRFRGR